MDRFTSNQSHNDVQLAICEPPGGTGWAI